MAFSLWWTACFREVKQRPSFIATTNCDVRPLTLVKVLMDEEWFHHFNKELQLLQRSAFRSNRDVGNYGICWTLSGCLIILSLDRILLVVAAFSTSNYSIIFTSICFVLPESFLLECYGIVGLLTIPTTTYTLLLHLALTPSFFCIGA